MEVGRGRPAATAAKEPDEMRHRQQSREGQEIFLRRSGATSWRGGWGWGWAERDPTETTLACSTSRSLLRASVRVPIVFYAPLRPKSS
jgi:hypothetical protein